MITLTKEWLLKTIAQLEEERDATPGAVNEDATMALAAMKLALASLEADSKLSDFVASQESLGVDFEKVLAENIEELYVPSKSTPPAPVSDSLLSELLGIAKRAADEADECAHAEWSDDSMEHSTAIADWERRAAMLQGAEPVTTACKLPDDFDFDRFNDVTWLEAVASNPHMHSLTTSTIAMVALELNRKLEAHGKPELTVWYGAMPETNGKTNWTAILHRKGEFLSTGITIDRSEYPDRVRYEADRMRHLIGELADEPDILAYDADAHSGYVEPVSPRYKLPAIGWLRADYQDDNRGLRGNAPLFVLGKKDPSTVWGLDYIPLTSNSPVIPDGWVMVPIEPTYQMCEAIGLPWENPRFPDRYKAMIAAAPHFREMRNSSTNNFRENAETSTNCPKCGGRGSYHCPQMLGTVECECTLPAAPQQEVK